MSNSARTGRYARSFSRLIGTLNCLSHLRALDGVQHTRARVPRLEQVTFACIPFSLCRKAARAEARGSSGYTHS